MELFNVHFIIIDDTYIVHIQSDSLDFTIKAKQKLERKFHHISSAQLINVNIFNDFDIESNAKRVCNQHSWRVAL